jgi:hypothetical protein
MYEFKNLKNAASFALRASKICLVFDGPDGGYVVAFGREAGELQANGLQPLSLQQVAKAASHDAPRRQRKG